MTDLPPMVRRAPYLFYGAAVLFFFAAMALHFREMNAVPTSYDEAMRPLIFTALARGFYQAALESVYLAANGVLAHILLAIWQDGRARRAQGGSE